MTDAVIDRLSAALGDRYRVERELGRGGMATVFLAEDLRHKRKVAIKVLKPELAAVVGAERFLAEIEVTAGLQHPHILPLFDSGEADSLVWYAMPHVDGESLRDRLDREKQLPVGDAVSIAVKVAGALQAAHERGVVHRDVKPANILLQDGEPLVADFGIALAVQEAGAGRLTETGLSLGTPYYMSPEQATADRDPDARSDIYSLACVLYEMLVGDPPHTASTAQAVVAKILTEDPRPVRELRRSVPDHVDAAVDRALERLPADRFASAAAFAAALEGRASAGGGRRSSTGRRSGSRAVPLLSAALVLAVVAALWGWFAPGEQPVGSPPTHLAVPIPNVGGSATSQLRQIALTPDGSTLFYSAISPEGGNRTMVRAMDETESRLLPGAVPGLAGYRVSPDGRELVGTTPTRAIHRLPVTGGGGQRLPDEIGPSTYFAWAPDGSIWFTRPFGAGSAYRLDPEGKLSEPIDLLGSDGSVQQVLPHGRTLLAVARSRGFAAGSAILVDMETAGTSVLLDRGVVEVRYTAGHLVYVLEDGTLNAVAFDPAEGVLLGEPVRIADGVLTTGTGIAQFDVSANGTVAYIPEEFRSLVLVDRDGGRREVSVGTQNFHSPVFSPDGSRLAVDFTTPDGRDVWVIHLDEGVPTRATFDGGGHDPRWTPDGQAIMYISTVPADGTIGIFRAFLGSLEAEMVTSGRGLTWTGIVLPDDGGLVTTADDLTPGSGADIVLVTDGGRGELAPVSASRFLEHQPSVSPDGRWVAWSSDQSGRFEVYARRLDGVGPVTQVSLQGGEEPVWSPAGGELFYRSAAGGSAMLVAATVRSGERLEVTHREPLFAVGDVATSVPHGNYDVSPDGQTFAMVAFNPSSRIMVIQNIPAFVRKRIGSGG